MYGKKILSIVGLLFLGCQISSVKATSCEITLANCDSTCTCSKKAETDCTDGYYAVQGANGDADNNGDKTPNTGITNGLLVKLSSSTTVCDIVSVNGYYKSPETGKVIAKSASGANMITAGNGCTAGKVDQDDDYKFCLDASTNKIPWNDGNYYLVDTAVATVFTGDTNGVEVVVSKDDAITAVSIGDDGKDYLVTNKKDSFGSSSVDDLIAIKNDGNDYSKVTTFVDADDYCVSDSTKQITKKIDNFCDNDLSAVDCDKYYTFEDTGNTFIIDIPKREVSIASTCTGITDLTSCADGDYYIVAASGSLQQTENGKGQLYKCTGTGTIQCSPDYNTIGYIKNSDPEKNGDSDIPYIQCDALDDGTNGAAGNNYCTAIAKPTAGACTSSLVGKLIYSAGDEYQVCIDGSTAKKLGDTAANYLVDASKASPFEKNGVKSGYFVVARIGGGNAIRKPQDQRKYIYAADKKVYAKGDTGASAICSSGTALNSNVEYILNKDVSSPATEDHVDYYKLNSN